MPGSTVGAEGCRNNAVAEPIANEMTVNAAGGGRVMIRTHLHPSKYRLGESWLQVVFDDGHLSEPVLVETPDLLAAIDLNGDSQMVIFVANDGNTARAGGMFLLRGCTLRRVVGTDGAPFSYLYYGSGRGCAPVLPQRRMPKARPRE